VIVAVNSLKQHTEFGHKKLLNNLSNVLSFQKSASLEISMKTWIKLIGNGKKAIEGVCEAIRYNFTLTVHSVK